MFPLKNKTFIYYRTRNKINQIFFEHFDHKRNVKRFFRRFQ